MMNSWDRHLGGERPQQRRKTPSFSSSLLDAICHSIDESREGRPKQALITKRDNAIEVEEESTSLRRAIMIEKWMENHTKYTRSSSRHINSDSSSSTESSLFSSSETDSAPRYKQPKSSSFVIQKPKQAQSEEHSERSHKAQSCETTPKREGRFTRTKSRALKIYGDLKKVKQPISPGSKIANFLNSIFTPRNLKKHQTPPEDWSSSVRKSRSVKDPGSTCAFASRSCLSSKVPSPRSKSSKRRVRFGPVSVIAGEDRHQLRVHKSVYDINDPSITPMPKISSHFIKENINSLQSYAEYNDEDDDDDEDEDDDRSCTSSDLFELDNIGIVGIGDVHREELPVYGTTSLKINQAIANGLVM